MAEDIEFSLQILYCLSYYFEYQTNECMTVLKVHLKSILKYQLFEIEKTALIFTNTKKTKYLQTKAELTLRDKEKLFDQPYSSVEMVFFFY